MWLYFFFHHENTIMRLSWVLFQFQFCFSPTLNSIWPPELSHKSFIDIRLIMIFFPILNSTMIGEKNINNNFSLTLNSIQPPGLGHRYDM